jgi:NADP-dependent 3-hydroxy acid dehydrogenase YdfG
VTLQRHLGQIGLPEEWWYMLACPTLASSWIAEGLSPSTHHAAEAASARRLMQEYRRIGLPADSMGRAVRWAIEQPADVDVNEITVRPAATRDA